MITKIILRAFILITFFSANSARTQINVSPESWNFEPRQIGTQSEPVVFTIVNQGASTITIAPEQIQVVSQDAQSVSLSVLTYNIWFDNQNWPARFAHMLSEIRDLDPDIIGLQEVIQRANLDNQAQMLADSLGYYYYFSSVDGEASPQRFGNAIVSRFPIEESNWRALQPLNDYRTAAHARINVEGNTIDIYNTHLHNAAVNTHIREQQILDMLDFIEETSSSEYIIVTGDFNANPDWEEMELMYEDFQDVYPLFHENHLDPEHGTLNYHLGHQQRRIDYIFFNKAKQETFVPTSAEVVIDEPDDNGIYGSDHFGVFANFDILSDADAFLLENISEPIDLQAGESAEVSLVFAPLVTGMHEAFLQVAGEQIPVSGDAFDATIHTFPWTEEFNGLENGEIPLGWERNAENWGAFNSFNAGGEAPEMIFWWQPVQEGELWIKTPQINTTGLDSMNLSFRHMVDNFGDPGIYNLSVVSIVGEEVFTIQQWIDPASISAEEITLQVNSTEHGIGDGIVQLAWIFDGVSDNLTRWAIDDIALSAEPALEVSPATFTFEPQVVYTQSQPKTFTLTNIGGGTLMITPEDISLSGEDATAFTLTNLQEVAELEYMETAEISIIFHPQSEGLKNANLMILETGILIEGLGFDPTITTLPWLEDFSSLEGGGVPLGWTRSSANWGAFNTANAGGEAPEMVFWWQPESTGQFYLTTPEIVTTDMDTLVLSFKHRVNNFGGPGQYTLKVVAIADETEHVIHQWINPESIAATEFTAIINNQNHGVGSESFKLAWVFDGITDNITQWDIDDILLSEPGETPILEVTPSTGDFGQESVGNTSEPIQFTIRNTGGGTLIVSPDNISLSGEDPSDFILQNLEETTELGTFQTAIFSVSFSPLQPGTRNAILNVQNIEIPLTGTGADPSDYFIYSDFTIPGLTNVEGFREIPGWAQGSINASDVSGEGEFGGVILELDYDLSLTDDLTGYWLWAFPLADIGGFDHIVLYVRASEPVENARLQVFDTHGIQGSDGAAYAHFNITTTDWQKIEIPLNEFTIMDWAENLPDMSRIQRVDLLMEKNNTTPEQAIIQVDLVGFSTGEVYVPQLEQADSFKMFPNPASNNVTLISSEAAIVSVIDLNGQVLITQRIQQEQTILDTSMLKSGVYLVRLQSQKGSMVKKLTIHNR
ncbi:MAG: choice-of-anchor D domain-containing protein [Bacteroidetes bacterium]|nr:MAG: choice-of-anchor D domain-containing protein [Bacteroidota bacterium]